MSSFKNPLSPDEDSFLPADKEAIRREDAEVLQRLIDAPARQTFTIPVGRATPEEAARYLRQVRERFRKPPEQD